MAAPKVWLKRRYIEKSIIFCIFMVVSIHLAAATSYYSEPQQPITYTRQGNSITVWNGDDAVTITLVQAPNFQRLDVVNRRNDRNDKKVDFVLVGVPNANGQVSFNFNASDSDLREDCGYQSFHQYDNSGNLRYIKVLFCEPYLFSKSINVDFTDYKRNFVFNWTRTASNRILTLSYNASQLRRVGNRYDLVIDPSFYSSGVCYIEGDYNDINTLLSSSCATSNRLVCNANFCTSTNSYFIGGNLNLTNITLLLNGTSQGSHYFDSNYSGNFTLYNSTLGINIFRGRFRTGGGKFTAYNSTFSRFGYSAAGSDWTAGMEFRNASVYINGFYVSGSSQDNIILRGALTNGTIGNGHIEGGGRYGIRLSVDPAGIGGEVGGTNNFLVGNVSISNKIYSIGGDAGDNNSFINITINKSTEIGAYFTGGYGTDFKIIRNLLIDGLTMNDSPFCDVDFGIFLGHGVLNATVKNSVVTGICGQFIATRHNYGIDIYSANDSKIINSTVQKIGNSSNTVNYGIAVKTDSGTQPKNIVLRNNTVKNLGRTNLKDNNYNIFVVSGFNMTIEDNFVQNNGDTNNDTGFPWMDLTNSTVKNNYITLTKAYGLVIVGQNNLYYGNNVTHARVDCVLSSVSNSLFVNNSYDVCDQGGVGASYAAFVRTGGHNNTHIQDKFISGGLSGYSFYDYSAESGETKCYNCTFSMPVYVEDAQAFRVLEYWQAFINSTGDVPLSSATVSCINSTGGASLWSATTSSLGFTDRYNLTREYYAPFAGGGPTETWGNINCTAAHSTYAPMTATVTWTHSWLIKDFWLNLTFPSSDALPEYPTSVYEDERESAVEFVFILLSGIMVLVGVAVFLRRRRPILPKEAKV